MKKNSLIICDLDNCLADDEWRRALINRGLEGRAKYDDYHALCDLDRPGNRHLIEPTQGKQAESGLILITGRPESYRTLTFRWLAFHGIVAHILLMRPERFLASAVHWKARALDMLVEEFGIDLSRVICAYDDRPEIIQMYRARGIPAECRGIYGPYAQKQERYSRELL